MSLDLAGLLGAIFGLCGATFLVLAAVAAQPRYTSRFGLALPVALGLQAAWCAAVLVNGSVRLLPVSLLGSLELARGLAWIVLLLRPVLPVRRRRLRTGLLAAGVVLVLLPLLSEVWTSPWSFALQRELGRWGGLLTAVAGLVAVEQFARNMRQDARWQLKHVALGAGLLFAAELLVWSAALLLGRLDSPLWLGRGVVDLGVAGLVAIGLRRLRGHDGALFVTEKIYFFNTTLALAGVYLMMMSVASWWLAAGGEISVPLVAAVFTAAAAVLLAVAVFSDQFRAWLRVSLSKLFRNYRYDYRNEWLKLTSVLAARSEEPVNERIVSVMASFVNSGRGALWLRDEDFRLVASSLPFKVPVTLPESAFFTELTEGEWIHDLDAERGHRKQRSERAPRSAAPDWLARENEAWLVVPLLNNADLLGLLVIGKPMTPTPLGWEQLDLLRVAARQVAGHVALQQAAAKLAELSQFEALNRLAAFVMHDLRHLVAGLDMIVKNAARHRNNPEFIDDAMETLQSSVQRMNVLMETLRQGGSADAHRHVSITDVVQDAVRRCGKGLPVPRLEIEEAVGEVMASRERLVQALEHLLRNAQDATPDEGSITVKIRRNSQTAVVDIADTGEGMEPEFVRTRLFRPFDSTKGERGMGLGAYEARDIVRKLGGDIIVDTAPGAGCRLQITLPLAPRLTP